MMRKIGRTNFELKFKSSGGENVHIFERPALFLDSDEQKQLKDENYTFSLKSTPNNQILDYGIFKDSDDGKFLEKCILTTVRYKKNE